MNTARFTQRAQLTLIVVLLASLLAVGQPWSFGLYKKAIVVIVVTGLAQVAVGNIPPDATVPRFMRLLSIFAGVIVALFAVSIWLAPKLVNLGR